MVLRLQIEGIRCFVTRQETVVRPLTLLVGENSSGKSTFLALCRMAPSIVEGFARKILFNEPPFLLGAYDQIASYRGGRAGVAKSFSVSMSVEEEEGRSGSIEATFAPEHGQPSLQSWRLSAGDVSFEVRRSGDANGATVLAQGPRGAEKFSYGEGDWALDLLQLPSWIPAGTGEPLRKLGLVFSAADQSRLIEMRDAVRWAVGQSPYAFAPIRTSPQRTYDPVSPVPRPEGSHVPMLLAQLSHSATGERWAELQAALSEFGAESGLYEAIEVIRKGKKESDPFQIGVKSGGPAFNLVDVGYGVSQVLPILVDTLLRSGENSTFLMQQPEVHLHPRAQAELGSFFARMAGEKRRFIVETHSDHLVDRVRMEVRRAEKITAQDVSLLYFERTKHGATIHHLELDDQGSIINPPAGYRQFFLQEENSLLGI